MSVRKWVAKWLLGIDADHVASSTFSMGYDFGYADGAAATKLVLVHSAKKKFFNQVNARILTLKQIESLIEVKPKPQIHLHSNLNYDDSITIKIIRVTSSNNPNHWVFETYFKHELIGEGSAPTYYEIDSLVFESLENYLGEKWFKFNANVVD